MIDDSGLQIRTQRAIKAELSRRGIHSLSREDLTKLLTPKNRHSWGLPPSVTVQRFAKTLVKAKVVAELRLEFPSRNHVRYLWDDPSSYEVAQSINRHGYLSHFTAMRLHGLTDQIPKTIYLNVEQQLAPGGGDLAQKSIDQAFQRRCRVTHNTAIYATENITVLSGGNTGCLGVTELTTEGKAPLRVSTIERTLIDIVVRPVYSGGVFEVAKAYRTARERVSVESLANMLHVLDYTYPYHQAIGYYLERAGFSSSKTKLLHAFPIEYDFYLDYAMRQTEFNSRWRLYIPKGF